MINNIFIRMKNRAKYGSIKGGRLILHVLNNKAIHLKNISCVIIAPIKLNLRNLIDYMFSNHYYFVIFLENEKQVEFTFSKKELENAKTFQKRIVKQKISENSKYYE